MGDLFGEEEWGHFFKLHPQVLRDFDVHLCESKPTACFQSVHKINCGALWILKVHYLFFSAGHLSLHRGRIESVGVVANDSLACFCFRESVGSDLCDARLVVTFENDAWATHHCIFQHVVCFFAGAVQICPSLYCSTEEVVQAYAREADCVFQNVYPLFCVERSHLFQSLQARRYIQIVVVL